MDWIDINVEKPPMSYFGDCHYEYGLMNTFIGLRNDGHAVSAFSYIVDSHEVVVESALSDYADFTHWIPFPGKIYKTEWNDINFKKPKEHGLYRVKYATRRGEEKFCPFETEKIWVGDNDEMRKKLRTEYDSNGDGNGDSYELPDSEKVGDIWADIYADTNGHVLKEYSVVTHWMQIDELSKLYKEKEKK